MPRGPAHLVAAAVAVIAMVTAGAGLMAAFMPFRIDVLGADGNGVGHDCPVPLASAFDDAGDGGGWFAYAPGTDRAVSLDHLCVSRARRRVSWGALGLVAGVGVALAVRPRLAQSMPTSG